MELTSTELPLFSFFDALTRMKGADCYRQNTVRFEKFVPPRTFTGFVAGSSGTFHSASVELSKDLSYIDSSKCSCGKTRNCEHCVAISLACVGLEQYRIAQPMAQNFEDEQIERCAAAPPRLEAAPPQIQLAPLQIVAAPQRIESVPPRTKPSFATRRKRTIDRHRQEIPPEDFLSLSPLLLSRLQILADALAVQREEGDQIQNWHHPSMYSPNQSPLRQKLLLSQTESRDYSTGFIAYVLNRRLEPTISSYYTYRPQGGEWCQSPISSSFVLEEKVGFLQNTAQDQEIAQLALQITDRFPVDLHNAPAAAVNSYLSKLINSGHFYLENVSATPLARGKAAHGMIVWKATGPGFQPTLVAFDEDRELEFLPAGDGWYIDKERMSIGRVNCQLPWSALMWFANGLEIPGIWKDQLNAILAKSGLNCVVAPVGFASKENSQSARVNAKSDFELHVEKPAITLKLVWHREVPKLGKTVKCFAAVSLEYARKNGEYFSDNGNLFYSVHDKTAFATIVKNLGELGLDFVDRADLKGANVSDYYFTYKKANGWARFVNSHADSLRRIGWSIDDSAAEQLLPINITELDISLTKEKAWWYSLKLGIEVNGEKISLLPILLEALQVLPPGEEITEESISVLNNNGFFEASLPQGKLIRISFERIASILIALGGITQTKSNLESVRLSAYEIDGLTELLPDRWAQTQEAGALEELRNSLAIIKENSLVEPAVKFKAQLRDYQRIGLQWLQCLAKNQLGGLLADDMGLGKTIQLLAHVALEKERNMLNGKPFLVVCPTSVLPNWLSEIQKFTPHLQVYKHYGPDREARIAQMSDADIVLTTYSILIRDQSLQNIEWHGIALDESQAIKNSNSRFAKAACQLKAAHRICITGTPIENHLGELWSQFQFFLPGYLGTHAEFKSAVRDPIERDGALAVKGQLSQSIRPFILRRTKNEVAKELPEKVKIIQVVELAGKQRDLYETVRLSCSTDVHNHIAQQGLNNSRISILSALQKLRQVCCDPRLLDGKHGSDGRSAKLDVLLNMLKDLASEGRKALVFSQFTSMLDLIAQELVSQNISYVQLRGDTRDRVTPVREFQDGKASVFLLSLKAGGSGLNLTAADVVIHYDPWWNPAAEEQATDRAHRIGQKNNVFVYKLIARGTIEEKMIDMQERKRLLASGILEAQQTDGKSLSLNEEDLKYLLAPVED